MSEQIHPTLVNASNNELIFEGQRIQKIDSIPFVVKHRPMYNQDGVFVNEEYICVENILDVSNFKYLVIVEPEVLQYTKSKHITGYISYREGATNPDGSVIIGYLFG